MAAPTTVNVTGTYYTSNGVLATGSVTFVAKGRPVNNVNVVAQRQTVKVPLVAGSIGTVTLVNTTNGYTVTEDVDGADRVTYDIAGNAGLDLSTVSPPGAVIPAPTAWSGPYVAATAYTPGTVVTRWGTDYVCLVACTGQDPARDRCCARRRIRLRSSPCEARKRTHARNRRLTACEVA